ncbi:MAG: Murein DD-endopeptidase MepM [Bacteroidetes bacterium ADurb.Bin408]|nr:MAG: Murein DD-endopeptidase MepM [Bacteroidetes bacterium ADurb.Bin408]
MVLNKAKFFLVCLGIASIKVFSQDSVNKFELKGEIIQGGLIWGVASNVSEIYLGNTKIKTDSAGHFIFGFDRDDTDKQSLKIIYKDNQIDFKVLTPVKRSYNIQRINELEQKYVSPPKELLEKIEKETKIIAEARLLIDNTDTAYYLSGFMRPVEGGRISGVFGGQRILNGEAKSPHNGIDIALPAGTPVYAMADGVVRLKGDDFHYNGNFILLDHGLGLSSVYVHLLKTFVSTGEKVTKGQKIGEVGSTGRSTGPHLHWGVQWYKKRIDPQAVLDLEK